MKVLRAAERPSGLGVGVGGRFRYVHQSRILTIASRSWSSQPRGGKQVEGIDKLPFDDSGMITELSAAELRVIRYLPSNLKAPEIASELFVSTNTIRTHLRHIYAKLGAHGRGEAVARARGLGLLAPSHRRR